MSNQTSDDLQKFLQNAQSTLEDIYNKYGFAIVLSLTVVAVGVGVGIVVGSRA